jgi:hypothetical protein
VNPWSPQAKYKADFDKMKCLEFTLTPGKTLFLPAYWWYSIKFINSDTSISCFRYRTYMNNVAVLPYIGLHALQIQNVKRNTTKKVSINELNSNVVEGEVITIENTNISNEVPNEVPNEAQNVVKSTTKIDDLPSYTKEETNNNQQI